MTLLLLGCFCAFSFWSIIIQGGFGDDVDSPWLAAMRLRDGLPLYSADPSTGYSYAPWLAWAWVPLTYLPPRLVFGVWMGVCFVSWYLSLRWAKPSPAVALLIGPLSFYGAWVGNVQPILIAALVGTLPRRTGPLFVGVAASLKVVPILLALPWVGRKEWTKAAIALAVTVVLGAPALLYDLRYYPFGLSPQFSLRAVSPVLWVGAVALSIAVALRVATTRFGALAAAVSVIAARPALITYDVSYLLTAIPRAGQFTPKATDKVSGQPRVRPS